MEKVAGANFVDRAIYSVVTATGNFLTLILFFLLVLLSVLVIPSSDPVEQMY